MLPRHILNNIHFTDPVDLPKELICFEPHNPGSREVFLNDNSMIKHRIAELSRPNSNSAVRMQKTFNLSPPRVAESMVWKIPRNHQVPPPEKETFRSPNSPV